MRKNRCNALLCVVLVLLMMVCCAAPAFAAYDPAMYDPAGHLTQIYVDGFESKWVYHPDDPGTSLLFPFDTDRLSAAFGNVSEYVKEALKNGDPRLAYHAFYDPLYDLFGETRLEPDGVTMQDTVTVKPTVIDESSDGNQFLFHYDTRLDPVDIAHELHDYIEWVKRDGVVHYSYNSPQVTDTIELVGSSYGASVVMAYLNEYGDEGLDSVVLCVPTTGGVDFVADLFTGNFYFDAAALRNFLSESNLLTDYAPLIDMLEKTGMMQLLLDVNVRPLLKAALTDAIHDIIHDVFGTFPAFWSFIDDDRYEAAKEWVFSTEEDKEVYGDFIEKIDYYHYNVQVRAKDIMQSAIDNGHKLSLICKYNTTLFPFSTQGNAMSDGFVTTAKESYGATCAESKHYLPDSYQQAALTDRVFLSPDRMIDASTCFLPYNTWFIKGLPHGEKPDVYYNMVYHVLYDDLDVFTSEEFPQFMEYSGGEDLHPLQPVSDEEKAEQEEYNSLLNVLKRFWTWLIAMLRNLFS